MIIRKTLLLLALGLTFGMQVTSQNSRTNEDGRRLNKSEMETKDYMPEIHGTIRGKFEYQPQISASRFEVRNARFSLTGNVHPMVAYKAEIDLSDEGRSRCWMRIPVSSR